MNMNRQTSTPLSVPRTRRMHGVAALTSMPAGKCVPLAAIPLLREDALTGNFRVQVEMLETKEILMNPVNLRVTAYVVPLLAFERFEGSRDQFDRSYKGEPQVEGGDVVDFIETHAMGAHGSNAVYKALGLHGKPTDTVNTAYLEAYNAIWNYRAKNRSRDLEARARLATTLAPAFWQHSRFAHIVPDFDQAVIDGEVAIQVVNPRLPVTGIGLHGTPASVETDKVAYDTLYSAGTTYAKAFKANVAELYVSSAVGDPLPQIFAELTDSGLSMSLSNLEMARKTQAFAKLRERYEGHDDDWIIDMLMDGLTIPDQFLKNPVLLADRTVRFSQVKRYATDSGNLAESAVSGGAMLDLRIRVPRLSTGGVVMVIAEAVPEQLFERQRDPFFHSQDVADWPEYLRDTLDPEKVDVVQNGEIDTAHTTATGTFGYAPMNWKWNSFGPRIGGKFYRPSTDASTDEERQRIWAIEAADPVLSEDFYIVSEMHTKPFLDTEAEPFEATVMGGAAIEGNTVFGGLLVEATNNYDKVLEKAPTERIEKDGE